MRIEWLEGLVRTGDHGARLELDEIHERMSTAEFALAVCREIDDPDDEFDDD